MLGGSLDVHSLGAANGGCGSSNSSTSPFVYQLYILNLSNRKTPGHGTGYTVEPLATYYRAGICISHNCHNRSIRNVSNIITASGVLRSVTGIIAVRAV